MNNNIGAKVNVVELDEKGIIVGSKRNWIGRMVFFVDTETLKSVSCYANELEFI